MTDEAANIVPFGKYRGQPVEAMMADQNYCAWALTQPGLRAKFPSLIAVIVNGGTAPDAPTPEHNRMQLLFRNPDMRVSTYRSIIGEELDGAIASWLGKSDPVVAAGDAAALAAVDEEIAKGTLNPELLRGRSGFSHHNGQLLPDQFNYLFHDWRDGADRNAREAAKARTETAYKSAAERKLQEIVMSGEAARRFDDRIRKQPVEFEVEGWDVVLAGLCGRIALELKPIMGDDYPAILRTMKNRTTYGYRRALVVDQFDAEAATIDDVKWLFAQSNIEVRTLAEIRDAMAEGV
jgi:hypothetical protein